MNDPSPVVVMDEAGNTGENLLDPEQPVYALAALHVTEADARAAVDSALARTQMPELKFSKLRTSGAGRRNILQLLDDFAPTHELACAAAAHKPWMLAAKLVDELVEPRMLANGQQMVWYASGTALRMAEVLYDRGPRALGELYSDLTAAFVPLVRDYSEDAAREFLVILRRCRIVCRDPDVMTILDSMIDTEADLASEFARREDTLDPALPSLWCLGSHWSDRFDEPFDVLHDDSRTIERWAHLFALARRSAAADEQASGRRPINSLVLGNVEVKMPVHLQGITFSQSHRDARLQLADVFAGAAAHLCGTATGLRIADAFVRELRRRNVAGLLQNWVGPKFDKRQVARLQ